MKFVAVVSFAIGAIQYKQTSWLKVYLSILNIKKDGAHPSFYNSIAIFSYYISKTIHNGSKIIVIDYAPEYTL